MFDRLLLPSQLRTLTTNLSSRSNRSHRFMAPWAVVALLCLLSIPAGAAPAPATTWTVNSTADAAYAPADCSGSNTCTLRDAITKANSDSGDTIVFDSTVFASTQTIALTTAGLPTISTSLTITGPGASKLTVSGANQYQVFKISWSGSQTNSVAISGLTITNGYLTTNGGCGGGGAAIYNDTKLTLTSIVVSGNTVVASGCPDGGGGAIFNDWDGNLTISNSIVSGNTINSSGVSVGGAGIDSGGAITVINSTVSGNTINVTGANAYGAGLDNDGNGSLTLTGSTVSGNTINLSGSGSGYGGGIYDWHAGNNTVVTNSTIYGNTITANNGNTGSGGGFYEATYDGNAVVTNTTIFGNSAGTGGGISYYDENDGTLTIANSIVSGNITGGTANSGDCSDCGDQSPFNLIGSTTALALTPLQLNGAGATTLTLMPLPGSTAICAGSSTLIGSATTDQRGFARTNTSYAALGYAGATPCVDLGAVQTNYTALQFVAQPTNSIINTALATSPTIKVLETNTAVTPNTTDAVIGVPVTLTYSGSRPLTGTLTETTAVGGLATFAGLTPTVDAIGATLSTQLPIITGATLTATSSAFNVSGTASSFTLSAATAATAGTAISFSVTAKDSLGNIAIGYAGTVHFTSTDTNAVMPANSTLTNGVGNFTATFKTAGTQTLTATDTVTGSIVGTSAAVAVAAAPVPDFTLTVTGANSQTVTRGGIATFTFSITPTIGAVTFTATGLPTGATASFSPTSVPAGGAAQPVTMTIQTSTTSAQLNQPSNRGKLAPLAFALLLLPLLGARKMRRQGRNWMICVLLLLGGLGTVAVCGCDSSSPKDYTVAVTATSGSITHSFNVTLAVK